MKDATPDISVKEKTLLTKATVTWKKNSVNLHTDNSLTIKTSHSSNNYLSYPLSSGFTLTRKGGGRD
jgi:hypothetical protein